MSIKVIASDMDGTFQRIKEAMIRSVLIIFEMPWLRVICTLSLHQVIV